MESAKSRFLRYVTYYTTSDEFTGTSPSTERQKDLGRALMQELEALKLEDVHMDDCGNVLATLPASEGVDAPVIALIAHMDTAPDASGENVKPRLVRYEGGELKLNDTVSLTEALCPGLESHVGEELIVTDGTTLLGADDKAGVAEIMAAVETMIEKTSNTAKCASSSRPTRRSATAWTGSTCRISAVTTATPWTAARSVRSNLKTSTPRPPF